MQAETRQSEAAGKAGKAEAAGATAPAEPVAELQARSGLYALLGRCLEAELDGELLALIRGPLRDALDEVGLQLGQDVFEDDEAALLDRLAEEFTALFVAPGGVLPYRSVFETGRLFQPQADLAAQAYRESGFEFRNVHSGEFSDHAAVMLSFVGRLLDRQAGALAAGDAGSAAIWEERRSRFLTVQIGPWLIGWARRARSCARHSFYVGLLELVEQVVWDDLCQLCDAKTLQRLVKANQKPLVRQKSDPEFRKASGL